jgi:hypothetical protein
LSHQYFILEELEPNFFNEKIAFFRSPPVEAVANFFSVKVM